MAPPPFPPPSAEAALGRMHATFACGNAIQANAKIDRLGEGARVRGDVMLFAARPARLRMDVVSPFGVAMATLTSDGQRFTMADLRGKRFLYGPATACNIARLTTVPVPGHVLVDLLRGEAPVLKHEASASAMAWDAAGYWLITLLGTNDSREQIRLAPRADDWARPWQNQRMRVLDVRVEQQGYTLYHAELDEHAEARTAGPREDPDNLAPPIPPSGPQCDAEIPRRIHVEVTHPDSDVRFVYGERMWNPPLPEGTFDEPVPPGMRAEQVFCE